MCRILKSLLPSPGAFRRLRCDRRASVSVELGLVVAFFFLPLAAGTADFLLVLTSRTQAAAALRTAEVFAWTNPSRSTDKTAIDAALALAASGRLATVSEAAPPRLSYACLQADGTTTPATITYNPGYSSADLATAAASKGLADQPVPSTSEAIGNGTIGTASCSSGYVQANVTYDLVATVPIPIPLPPFGDSWTNEAKGTIWVH